MLYFGFHFPVKTTVKYNTTVPADKNAASITSPMPNLPDFLSIRPRKVVRSSFIARALSIMPSQFPAPYPRIAVSHPYLSGDSPRQMARYSFCSFSVIGPRLPSPTWILSTERTGVTSEAVPVKKISLAV